MQVFFSIFMAAQGAAQAQLFFPDVAKGRAATQVRGAGVCGQPFELRAWQAFWAAQVCGAGRPAACRALAGWDCRGAAGVVGNLCWLGHDAPSRCDGTAVA